ncbi:MAG: hypothetical protein HYZ73_08535 [Elusimicrobia bacterium]|nr:hypothetical protein [Elusimicrobiota bacterium]
MGKLIVEVPDSVHVTLKRYAFTHHTTLKDIILTLLNRFLSQPSRSGPTRKTTGFCGVWQDPRRPEEIVRDIRTHRRWFQRPPQA